MQRMNLPERHESQKTLFIILKKQESFISYETLHGIFEEDDYNEVLAAWFKYSGRFGYDNEAESFQVKTI